MYKRFVLFYAERESQFFCKQLEVSKTLWLSNLFKTSIASWIGLKHSLVNYLCGTWLLLQVYIKTQLYKQRLLTDWLDLADTFSLLKSTDISNYFVSRFFAEQPLKVTGVFNSPEDKQCVCWKEWHWRNRDWHSVYTQNHVNCREGGRQSKWLTKEGGFKQSFW